MQSNWRWCRKCQGLAFSPNQPSVCSAGGSHDHSQSGNYTLAVDDPSAQGQSDWRWCRKCQGLAFSLNQPSVCPAGGNHDHSQSSNYTLALDDPSAPGQSDWRWCRKCQGLAFSPNQLSVCPAGGSHDHSQSGNYTLASEQDVLTGAESLASDQDVPPGAKSGAYWPGEVEKSQKSGGQVLDTPPPESGGDGVAFFYDFLPCSSELRPAHGKLIGIIRTRMGWPSVLHDGHLLHLQGTVDEIEGFTGQGGLDKARAVAVLQAFDSTGEFIATTSPPEVNTDDPEVEALGVNSVTEEGTPEARSTARSVQVTYSVPARETMKPQWPADTKSRRWAITQVVGSSAVVGGGWVDISFDVKNLESGQEYIAHFSGFAKGGAISLSLHMPGYEHNWSEFSTDEPIAAIGLDGPNTVYEVLAAEMEPAPVGGSLASLTLGRLRTTPRKIVLSNAPELSASPTPLSGVVAKGTFTVLGPK